jgi:hypothetical protein
MQKKPFLAALFLLSCGSAFAQVGAGLQVGTTGFGTDLGYQISDSLGVRVGYSGFHYSKSANTSDVQYDGTLKISSFHLLADWDLGRGFRVTGGLAYNDNKIDVTGNATNGTYVINGVSYPSSSIGSLTGHVKLGDGVAPYLGVGYGMLGKTKGLGFYADLGVMYQGKAKTTLSATCGSAVSASQCSSLMTNLDSEQQQLQDKMNKYSWYPVATVGVSYSF